MALREDSGHRRRLTLLTPLRQRDFALLWTGMTVSLIGDGMYFVARAPRRQRRRSGGDRAD